MTFSNFYQEDGDLYCFKKYSSFGREAPRFSSIDERLNRNTFFDFIESL